MLEASVLLISSCSFPQHECAYRINVDQKEIKITQYADDTTVLVSDCNSILRLLKLLEEFKQVSRLQINTKENEESQSRESCLFNS